MAAVGDESGTCDRVSATTAPPPTTTTTTATPPPTTSTVAPTTTTSTVTTTTNPSTTTTSGSVAVLECSVQGLSYNGTQIQTKKKNAGNWKKCMKRCKKNRKCENYTYYQKKGNVKKLRKKCFLWETVTTVSETANALSGHPDSC